MFGDAAYVEQFGMQIVQSQTIVTQIFVNLIISYL